MVLSAFARAAAIRPAAARPSSETCGLGEFAIDIAFSSSEGFIFL
jgi:hypothetical protein